jgi:signal transduction histidine kinase
MVGDVSKNNDYIQADSKTKSDLTVPVKIEEEVIGMISVEHPNIDAFDEEDQRAQEALAAQAAIAIRNARQYEKLRELDRKKLDLVDTVSHDLRAPLAHVKWCIEYMLTEIDGPINADQRKHLHSAFAAARHEAQLIENLLDLARIQGDRETLDLKYGSVAQIIEEMVNMLGYEALECNLNLYKKIARNDRLETQMDVSKIRQVIANLLSNAIKFTNPGGNIVIKANRRKNKIIVQVIDNGIGIVAEECQRIFERYYKVENQFTKKVSGTGIGLSIAKNFVELHGGLLWVDSEPGKGSTFSFTLPIQN